MAIVGVLAASFSLRIEEPNPCNVRIAEETIRICRELTASGHTVILAVQWEVGLALQQIQSLTYVMPEEKLYSGWLYFEVGLYEDGSYLGTKELYEDVRVFLKTQGVTHFVGVANPFIHLQYLYWLARKDFKLMPRAVKWIGFDKESTQEWCRSPLKFAVHTLRLALGKSHGYNNRQAAS